MSIWTALGGAAIAGGTALVSSIINKKATEKANEENEAFQTQQQQQMEDYNTKMWQMQSDYNTPSAQMDRLRAAGLNPNLVYGAGDVSGNVAQLPAAAPETHFEAKPATVDFGSAANSALAQYNAIRSTDAQTNNLQANTTNALADAVLKGFQAGLVQAQTTTEDYKPANVAEDTVLKAAQAVNATAQSNETNTLLAPRTANMNADTNLKKVEAQTGLTRVQLETAMTATSIQQALVNMTYMKAQTAKSDTERSKLMSDIKFINDSDTIKKLDAQIQSKDIALHSPGWFYTLAQGLRMITGNTAGAAFGSAAGNAAAATLIP